MDLYDIIRCKLIEAVVNSRITKKLGLSWNLSKAEAYHRRGDTTDHGSNKTHTFHKIDRGQDPKKDHDHVTYYAKNKTTGNIDLTVNCKEKEKDNYIGTMAKHPDATIKMHHFLHHLITKHKKRFGTDHVSSGGKRTMEALSKMKGVGVTPFRQHKSIKNKRLFSDHPEADHYIHVVAHPAEEIKRENE